MTASGGIRAGLVENAAGDLTYGAAFAVQPFNNFMVSISLTEAQTRAILNQQWNGGNEATASGTKILQVAGLRYTWDASDAASSAPDALVGGLDIDALRVYLQAHDPVALTPTDRISQQP